LFRQSFSDNEKNGIIDNKISNGKLRNTIRKKNYKKLNIIYDDNTNLFRLNVYKKAGEYQI